MLRLHITIHPYERLYNNNELTHFIDNNREMRVNSENQCICLVDGLCSIYNKRPVECRLFEVNSDCCVKLRNGIKTLHICPTCIITNKAKEFKE